MISTPDRYKMVELVRRGFSYSEVAERVGFSKNAVSYNVRKMEIEGNLRDRSRSGRPKKVDDRGERALVHMALQDPLASSREIAQHHNVGLKTSNQISDRSVRSILHRNGLKALVRPQKWLISEKNQKARLSFAKNFKNIGMAFWERIIFSDESLFESGVGRRTVRARNSDEALRKFAIHRERQGARVMAWGAISSMGEKVLIFLDENVTGARYRDTLEGHLLPNFPELEGGELIFQHDNAPAHRAHLVADFLENSDVTTLTWPPQSPDINIIENLWAIIKRRLEASYETQEALRRDVRRIWDEIEVPVLNNLYSSIPSRLEEVIKNRGGPTRF